MFIAGRCDPYAVIIKSEIERRPVDPDTRHFIFLRVFQRVSKILSGSTGDPFAFSVFGRVRKSVFHDSLLAFGASAEYIVAVARVRSSSLAINGWPGILDPVGLLRFRLLLL